MIGGLYTEGASLGDSDGRIVGEIDEDDVGLSVVGDVVGDVVGGSDWNNTIKGVLRPVEATFADDPARVAIKIIKPRTNPIRATFHDFSCSSLLTT